MVWRQCELWKSCSSISRDAFDANVPFIDVQRTGVNLIIFVLDHFFYTLVKLLARKNISESKTPERSEWAGSMHDKGIFLSATPLCLASMIKDSQVNTCSRVDTSCSRARSKTARRAALHANE